MRKAYFGETGKQIHYLTCPSNGPENHEPLLCLPPAPHSGLFYTNVMERLAQNRQVISVDYPGYGGSDPVDGPQTIEIIAQSVTELCFDKGPVDLMGFHSGCLVALELAHSIPEMIGKVIIVDAPFFEQKTRAAYLEKFPAVTELPNTAADLDGRFETEVTKRMGQLDKARGYDLWVETLRAGEGLNDTFRAAFSYDCETKFASLDKEIDVIATTGGLLEPTRQAAKVLPNSTLTECLDINGGVFEIGAETISAEVLNVLSS